MLAIAHSGPPPHFDQAIAPAEIEGRASTLSGIQLIKQPLTFHHTHMS